MIFAPCMEFDTRTGELITGHSTVTLTVSQARALALALQDFAKRKRSAISRDGARKGAEARKEKTDGQARTV